MEAAGWRKEAVIAGYVEGFGPVTDQAAARIFDALAPGPGMRVLDLCCGDGRLLSRLAKSGAAATGLDFSPEMCRLAARAAPGARVLEGRAEAIPLENASLDSVVCTFGFGHIPDPDAALAEVRRVLVPGGRLHLSAWVDPARSPAFAILFGALKAHGDLSVRLPAPDFFEFGDRSSAAPRLSAAGLQIDRADVFEANWRFADPDGLFRLFETGTVSAAGLLGRQTPEARTAVKAAMRTQVAEGFETGGGFHVPVAIGIISAIRA
jgi:SAM-dependent methyltransferase